ncbi:proline-rich receptor-like protein kinase PERK3 [Aristolochia californica]|uniref:proline-rich receptor-like protein kinase PERK3 n=1 Tax=Aristolochia californica TaxID=171875 RepID=UPI0035DE2091
MRRRQPLPPPLQAAVILVVYFTAASGAATCPYNLPAASSLVPSFCYANYTGVDPGNCCWYVSAAYLFAGVKYSNISGQAFLPQANASACSDGFASFLVRNGLARSSLVHSGDRCNVNSTVGAETRPCLYPTVARILSVVNLSDSIRACTKGKDLSEQASCTTCQNAVIAATLALLDVTKSKEFVPCGMAATIGIWASWSEGRHFQSYVLCMLQILDSVPDLSTSNLIPSPPSSMDKTSRSNQKKSSAGKIAAGIAAGTFVSLVVGLVLAFFASRRRGETKDGYSTATIKSPLPVVGLYIFTKKELRAATNGYDRKLLLGQGGAGRVYLGTLPSGQCVAIKKIYLKRKVNEFYQELEILAKLRHRSLTTLVGYCVQRREHILVYEYMAGGTLATALRHGELSWEHRVRIAEEVAEALAFLHSTRVVHRDVKPGNVLLTESGEAKLSDFGVSKVVPSEMTHVSTQVKGTLGYLDPECFPAGQVSEASDVYSFGIVLLELVTGRRAVQATATGGAESIVQCAREVVEIVEGGGEPEMEKIMDPRLGKEIEPGSVQEVFNLACRCVRPFRRERPTMEEVLGVLRRVLVEVTGRITSAPVMAALLPGPDSISDGKSGEFSSRLSTRTIGSWSP